MKKITIYDKNHKHLQKKLSAMETQLIDLNYKKKFRDNQNIKTAKIRDYSYQELLLLSVKEIWRLKNNCSKWAALYRFNVGSYLCLKAMAKLIKEEKKSYGGLTNLYYLKYLLNDSQPYKNVWRMISDPSAYMYYYSPYETRAAIMKFIELLPNLQLKLKLGIEKEFENFENSWKDLTGYQKVHPFFETYCTFFTDFLL